MKASAACSISIPRPSATRGAPPAIACSINGVGCAPYIMSITSRARENRVGCIAIPIPVRLADVALIKISSIIRGSSASVVSGEFSISNGITESHWADVPSNCAHRCATDCAFSRLLFATRICSAPASRRAPITPWAAPPAPISSMRCPEIDPSPPRRRSMSRTRP